MTSRFFAFCPSLLGVVSFLIALSPEGRSQVVYTAGDIILGFHAGGGDGANDIYVYNLGAGTGFRDGTTTGSVANIGVDLASIYGPGWYERNDLYWGIAGVRDANGGGAIGLVDGDPRATIYISRTATTPGASPVWVLPTDGVNPNRSNATINTAGSIESMQIYFRTINGTTPREATSNSGGRGAQQIASENSNWKSFNPVNEAAFSGALTGGVQAALGTGQALSHLDLYRLIGRTSEQATPNTPAGQGLLLGTFSINAAGEITYAVASEPPTGGYDEWADSFALTGADRAFDADPDGDGIGNGVEFVLGGNPATGAEGDRAPTFVQSAGVIEFVFRRTAASATASVTPRVEHSADLATAWTPAVDGADGVTITTEADGFGAGIDRITVRVPATGAAHFARLTATATP